MNYCITIGTEDAFSGALVVFRGLQNLRTIAELGYDGIELALFDKKNIEVAELKRLLAQYQLKLPVISTGQVFTMRQAWFTHPDPEVRQKAVRIVKSLIDIAAEFGATVNISRVRGYIHEGDSYNDTIHRLTQCLEELCAYTAQFGLNLVLEQMNRYETNYLLSAAEVGDYINSLEIPNLKIHADLFHMNIEDIGLTATLKKYQSILGYIHFADSNRMAPGQGNIDFAAIMKALWEINYQGWIGMEVSPQPDPYCAAKQSIEFLRRVTASIS
jgi:sugar phosphate isomerase/epimerase